MKTLKKAVVLLAVLPFLYASAFAVDYFEVSKPNIKKAGVHITSTKSTTLNRVFVTQLKDMLKDSLLFNNVSSVQAADYAIVLANSVESKELLVTIKGVKQSAFPAKFFGIRFKETELGYVKRKTAQMGNRILKELFGIAGSLGSSITWSVTENTRKVIYKRDFSVPDSTKQITYNFYSNYGASWNKQKDQVIYTSHTDFGTVINLQQVEPLLFKSHEIYTQSGKASSPIWAPDGSVFMTLHVSDQNSDIFQFKLDGSLNENNLTLKRVRQITYIPSIETEPTISPDSKKMAFVSDQTSEPQIYILDLNTQKTKRITRKGGYNVSPSWSPNGRYLAFRSIRQGVSAVYRIDVDSGEEKRLTNSRIDADEPTWSSDGSLIAFTGKTSRKGTSKIYYMLASGGEFKRLTNSATSVVESSPTWGPGLF